MAPVQSRLVLAVTIPAAAFAIFLSLLWLKRTSKGHPPSPPDKQSRDLPVQLGQSSGDADSAVSSSCENQTEGRRSSLEPVVLTVERKELLTEVSREELAAEPDKKEPEEVCHASVDKSGSDIEDKFACGELIETVKLVDASPNLLGSGEDGLSERVVGGDTISSCEEETTSTYKTSNTVVIKEITSTGPVLEETVVPVAATETSQSALPDSCESTVESRTDKQEGGTSGGDKMMTEEVLSGQMVTGAEKSDLSEKLVNLELDTMKLGEVDVKERDSANHSPSEVMLASPSMSTFSDAHSEGSSDSGKGHSDGTTSPSRTPAGGSSVSGDPSPSIYEFVVPQVIVGRLIGRHGVFLNEIMSETHTSIFIKVHPETVKLKICAIEGSQADIDKALEKIRKRFPLRRHPKLTLERVSFLPAQPCQQLRAEDFHLQLIEGVNNDVILSSLLSPGQFFVQQQSHPSYPCLTPLTQVLTQAYSTTDAPSLVSPVADAICVCPSLGGWYRAQVVSVEEDSRHCQIKFVDYGGYLRVDTSLLKQIRAEFLMLPFQAVECALANVQPIEENGWSEEARVFVHNITFGRVLQAQIVSYMESGVPLVNLYTGINNQVVLVNAELVSNGFAQYVNSVDNGVAGSEELKDEAVAASNDAAAATLKPSDEVTWL